MLPTNRLAVAQRLAVDIGQWRCVTVNRRRRLGRVPVVAVTVREDERRSCIAPEEVAVVRKIARTVEAHEQIGDCLCGVDGTHLILSALETVIRCVEGTASRIAILAGTGHDPERLHLHQAEVALYFDFAHSEESKDFPATQLSSTET